MGDRYWITGTQLGILLEENEQCDTFKDKNTEDVLTDICANQYLCTAQEFKKIKTKLEGKK